MRGTILFLWLLLCVVLVAPTASNAAPCDNGRCLTGILEVPVSAVVAASKLPVAVGETAVKVSVSLGKRAVKETVRVAKGVGRVGKVAVRAAVVVPVRLAVKPARLAARAVGWPLRLARRR